MAKGTNKRNRSATKENCGEHERPYEKVLGRKKNKEAGISIEEVDDFFTYLRNGGFIING